MQEPSVVGGSDSLFPSKVPARIGASSARLPEHCFHHSPAEAGQLSKGGSAASAQVIVPKLPAASVVVPRHAAGRSI
jgi:hypothetical protein